MKNTTKRIVLGTFAAGLAGAAVVLLQARAAQSGADHRVRPAAGEVRAVRTGEVAERSEARALRFSGVVRAERRAQLAFSIPGRLAARAADLGERVRAGATLARLDAGEYVNAVRAAEARRAGAVAQRDQLRRDRERVARLAARSAAGAEELEKVAAGLDAAEASVAAADAHLAEMRRLVRESRLRAPFDGTVSAVLLEPGEYARPGAPVVVLSGDGALEVEVEVPEAIVGGLREGAEVEVALPLAGGTARGTVRTIGRAAVGPGSLFPVVVALDGDGVVPGGTAEVALRAEVAARLVVPVEAIVDPGGKSPFLYRLRGDRAERVAVSVTALDGDGVAVTGDLAAGDEVIVGGHAFLVDGERVEVIR